MPIPEKFKDDKVNLYLAAGEGMPFIVAILPAKPRQYDPEVREITDDLETLPYLLMEA